MRACCRNSVNISLSIFGSCPEFGLRKNAIINVQLLIAFFLYTLKIYCPSLLVMFIGRETVMTVHVLFRWCTLCSSSCLFRISWNAIAWSLVTTHDYRLRIVGMIFVQLEGLPWCFFDSIFLVILLECLSHHYHQGKTNRRWTLQWVDLIIPQQVAFGSVSYTHLTLPTIYSV